MTRTLGVAELLSGLPDPLVVLAALLTQFGDVWFLTLVVALTYWYGPASVYVDRPRAGLVVGTFLLGLALVVVLKPLVAAPRPPGAGTPPATEFVPPSLAPVYGWLATADGYGVPSGHAFGTTVVYGALAWAVRVGRRRRRALAAGVAVAVVALTRLVLGVHYLADVLVGASLGVVVLAVALRLLGTTAQVLGLALAVLVAGLAVVPGHEVAATAGVCAGATAAWLAVGDRIGEPTRPGALGTVGLGLASAAPLLALASAVDAAVLGALLGSAGGALLVALPLAGERIAERTPSVQ